MESWFTEHHTKGSGLTFRVTKSLYSKKSKWQKIEVVDSETFGKVLLLDGLVMFSERDEFVYHEMIVHVPLCSHSDPRDVLIIGGGDGGSVRELLKHPSVETITLVEIDKEVIDSCREYFPNISKDLDNSRVKIEVADGARFVKETDQKYDVVLMDTSDPVGPGVILFEKEFYRDVATVLKPDGILTAQAESPFYHSEIQKKMIAALAGIFPQVNMYLAYIPTYPAGMWSFILASKQDSPFNLQIERSREISSTTQYYNPEIHRASFALPNFVEKMKREAEKK